MVAGDRGGEVSFWDINNGKSVFKGPLHAGAVHKIKVFSEENAHLIISAGGKDGKIVVKDMRDNSNVFAGQVHGGAINMLEVSRDNSIVSASADKSIVSLDSAMGFAVRSSLQTTESVLCGELIEDLVVVGCADGNVLVFALCQQDCLFGFGADSQGGVNAVKVTPDRQGLLAGGESGVPLLLSFS